MYAFIDESGDAQLTKKSTRHFVLAAIIFETPEIPRRIARSVFKKFKLGKMGQTQLHATHDSARIKLRILNEVRKVKHSIEYIAIKKKVKEFDYYIEAFEQLALKLKDKNIETVFVATKDIRKSHRIKLIALGVKNNLKPEFYNTEFEKGLQIADFLSWTIFQKYEKDDPDFYDLLLE